MKDLYKEITFFALAMERILIVNVLSLLYEAYRGVTGAWKSVPWMSERREGANCFPPSFVNGLSSLIRIYAG